MGKFDRIKHALTIFGFEDELSIKYADWQLIMGISGLYSKYFNIPQG
jgi:hypothetical protein